MSSKVCTESLRESHAARRLAFRDLLLERVRVRVRVLLRVRLFVSVIEAAALLEDDTVLVEAVVL